MLPHIVFAFLHLTGVVYQTVIDLNFSFFSAHFVMHFFFACTLPSFSPFQVSLICPYIFFASPHVYVLNQLQIDCMLI